MKRNRMPEPDLYVGDEFGSDDRDPEDPSPSLFDEWADDYDVWMDEGE